MWDVFLSDEAVRQFRRLSKSDRAFVKEGIRVHLTESDPGEGSRNKFRLRRPSPHADYELRLDSWRVFYRLSGRRVEVTMMGEKRGNILFIEGKEFLL